MIFHLILECSIFINHGDVEVRKTIIQLLMMIKITPSHSRGVGRLPQNKYPKSSVQPSLVYISVEMEVAEVFESW